MSDPVLFDSSPSGGVILAYGESSTMPRRSRAFFVGVGILIFLTAFLIATLAWVLTTRIPVPRNTLLIAYVRPGAALPDWTPHLWKETQIRARPFPVFVGLQFNNSGEIMPFAIMRSGLRWQNLSPSSEDQPTHLLALSASWSDYFQPVWLQVWPTAINELMNATSSSSNVNEAHIGGPITDHVWRTNGSVQHIANLSHLPQLGPNSLDLQYFPDLWPLLQNLFRTKGVTPVLPTPPTRVAWAENEQGDISIGFQFNELLSSTTKAELAGSFGLTERKPYTLPDNTVLMERRLPYDLFQTSTTTEWALAENKKLIFSENQVIFGQPDLLIPAPPLPAVCQGTRIGAFDTKTLASIRQAFQLQSEVDIPRLILVEKNGELRVCW